MVDLYHYMTAGLIFTDVCDRVHYFSGYRN